MVALDPVIEKPRLKKLGVSNKGISAILCLANVNPILTSEWHPTKNGALTPWDVTPGSSQKVWWICSKGHDWKSNINHRSGGSGCPYCSGRKATKENCLQTVNPKLASEWHPTKNGTLTPKDVTRSSAKKVWWICSEGHDWVASVYARHRGRGCPYCSGKRVCKDNCLQTVNPTLASEWHSTKNGTLTPLDVTRGSRKKVWWKCSEGHEWKAIIYHRNNGRGCIHCYHAKRVCKDNCLQTVNPTLASEWHSTKNGTLTPLDVTANSSKKVWWKCSEGHEWYGLIYYRNKGIKCLQCRKERRTKW